MQALNLPKAELKISRLKGDLWVWCEIRNKKLRLTPEEWVRQHAIHFLIQHHQYPKGMIASELGITVNSLQRRCDLVVFGADRQPKMIVECKASEIKLTDAVLHQIAQYNSTLAVPFLWVTNGLEHILLHINSQGKMNKLMQFPCYEDLNQSADWSL